MYRTTAHLVGRISQQKVNQNIFPIRMLPRVHHPAPGSVLIYVGPPKLHAGFAHAIHGAGGRQRLIDPDPEHGRKLSTRVVLCACLVHPRVTPLVSQLVVGVPIDNGRYGCIHLVDLGFRF